MPIIYKTCNECGRQNYGKFICHKCKKEMIYGGIDLEYQEALTWFNQGGYKSIFGDGVKYQIVLCQHCIKEVLGEYIEYIDDEKES